MRRDPSPRLRSLLITAVAMTMIAMPTAAGAVPASPSPAPSSPAPSSPAPSSPAPSSPAPSPPETSPTEPSSATPSTPAEPSPGTPSATGSVTPEPSATDRTPTPEPEAAPTPSTTPTAPGSSESPEPPPSAEPEEAGHPRRLAAVADGPIADRYERSGGAKGRLGEQTRAERAVPGGRMAGYEHGAIYWSSATGARIVMDTELRSFDDVGGVRALGFPTNERACTLVRGGCLQVFTRGQVMGSPDTGFHALFGALGGRYLAGGTYERTLGLPLDRERCGIRSGGCYQNFQYGGIYWTAKTGVHAVVDRVYRVWSDQQWERGPLGYPTGDLVCGLVRGGCYQRFQGGNLYRTAADDIIAVGGTIFGSWGAAAWERGSMGYPTSREYCGQAGGGCYQKFEEGWILYSPRYGTFRVFGAIRQAYAAQDWHRGYLGYPTANENCALLGGGCVQTFAGGAIYFSPAAGTHSVVGRILSTWRAAGAQEGPARYPVAAESCSKTECAQRFQNGTVRHTFATGRTTIEIRGIQTVIRRTTASDVRHTYRSGCPVPPSRLRTIEMNYWGQDGIIRRGELIVRDSIADRVARAFADAYAKRWPIARMDNPNLWRGDDPAMMRANLTSGFNCRPVVGNPYATSPHSYGTAIDTNPVQNPYRDRNGTWWPSNGKGYILGAPLNRPRIHPSVMTTSTVFVQAMEKQGFFWGGRWSPGRDYHHFEDR